MKSWLHIASRTCAKKKRAPVWKNVIFLVFFNETFKFTAIFRTPFAYLSLESRPLRNQTVT